MSVPNGARAELRIVFEVTGQDDDEYRASIESATVNRLKDGAVAYVVTDPDMLNIVRPGMLCLVKGAVVPADG